MTVPLPHLSPGADASAHEIIEHLAKILQTVRTPLAKSSGDKLSLAAHRHDMLDALRVFTLTPFEDADEKWRTIAASPKAMAIINDLRDYEDEDEYVHEVECSDRIVRDIEHGGMSPTAALEQFDWMHRYRRYQCIETNLIRGSGHDFNAPDANVMFIGSGPFPLTAWLVLETITASRNSTLTCVELVPEANTQGHTLFRALLQDNDKTEMQPLASSNGGRVEFLTANAMNIDPDLLAQQDIIYVAAMVNQPSKRQVLRQVVNCMKPGARMLCRSGNGLRQVMYEHVPDEWFVGTRGEVEMRAQSSHTMVGQVIIKIKPEGE